MSYHMILENGVLKAVPLPVKPVAFRNEIHGNAKYMGNFYPVRGAAVEVVQNVPFRVDPSERFATPVVQSAEPKVPEKIELPKPVVAAEAAQAPQTAFAAASITFDEPEDDNASERPVEPKVVVEPVKPATPEEVAQMLATQDVRNMGMSMKDFNAYQLKGAQVRKVYEALTQSEAADMGINRMTKAILEEAGKSTERCVEVTRLILDVKRGAA